ncbi:MAG: tetratricopeptide repeat protein, partial [Planctomycetes bacterium]|nr:tetratricopeptide repeat protein [Planctomycetota bacterium]
EKALEQIDKALKIAPNSAGAYFLRAQIRVAQKQLDLALEDYDRVIRLSPTEIQFGLHVKKAQECLQPYVDDMPPEAAQKFHKSAVQDLTTALLLKPGSEDALLLRAIANGVLKQYGPAVADLRGLVQLHPDKLEYQLQLAAFLIRDERPRKAIEVYDQILERNDSFDRARLGRADAWLSVGEHAQAIAEYEKLLAKEPQQVLESILNNFAWVLATSPDDALRNGKRSIELAQRACELSEYKQPHILSTLAAGYAEAKEFDMARQWSEKAVELGKNHPDLEQLKSELDSYRRNEPWREKELVQEKNEPELPSGVDLEDDQDKDPDLGTNQEEESVDDDADPPKSEDDDATDQQHQE